MMQRQPYLDPHLSHNSALACFLLAEAARQYQKLTDNPLPISKAFLVLPILWHQASCSNVAKRQFASTLSNVLSQFPMLRIGFRRRMQAFAAPTLQGLNLARASGLIDVIVLDDETYLNAMTDPLGKRALVDVPSDMVRALSRIVPWLAKHPPETLYHLFLKD